LGPAYDSLFVLSELGLHGPACLPPYTGWSATNHRKYGIYFVDASKITRRGTRMRLVNGRPAVDSITLKADANRRCGVFLDELSDCFTSCSILRELPANALVFRMTT
jgi:hypothetical protein